MLRTESVRPMSAAISVVAVIVVTVARVSVPGVVVARRLTVVPVVMVAVGVVCSGRGLVLGGRHGVVLFPQLGVG